MVEEHHQHFLGGCYPQTASIYSFSYMSSAKFDEVPSDHDSTVTSYDLQSSNTGSSEENHPMLQSAGTLLSLVKSGYGFGRIGSSAAENSASTHQNTKIGSRSLREPDHSEATFSVTSGDSVTRDRPSPSTKTRMRWTQDLHERFLECVNHLGGAEKATPKRILKMMNSNELTIFHVKSHLQKYRMAKYNPKSSVGVQCGTDSQEQLDSKTGMQIVEALRQQIDVQRRLCEQLESQKHLQRQIEEQGKQLKEMLEHQMRKK